MEEMRVTLSTVEDLKKYQKRQSEKVDGLNSDEQRIEVNGVEIILPKTRDLSDHDINALFDKVDLIVEENNGNTVNKIHIYDDNIFFGTISEHTEGGLHVDLSEVFAT